MTGTETTISTTDTITTPTFNPIPTPTFTEITTPTFFSPTAPSSTTTTTTTTENLTTVISPLPNIEIIDTCQIPKDWSCGNENWGFDKELLVGAFNLLVRNSLVIKDGVDINIEGRLGVGGTVSFNSLKVGTKLQTITTTNPLTKTTCSIIDEELRRNKLPLYLDNAIIFDSGFSEFMNKSKYQVDVFGGGVAVSNGSGLDVGNFHMGMEECLVKTEKPIEFHNAFGYLGNLSLALNNLSPTDRHIIDINDITNLQLELSDTTTNSSTRIITIQQSEFFSRNRISFKRYKNQLSNVFSCSDITLIINILGKNVEFIDLDMEDLEIKSGSIIFNFYEAESLLLKNTKMVGMVLAPFANITISGMVSGNLYSDSLISGISNSATSLEFLKRPYIGCIPPIKFSKSDNMSVGTIAAVTAGVVAVGAAGAAAMFYRSGSVGTQMLNLATGDAFSSAAKANPLYQAPGGHFDNPLYEGGIGGEGLDLNNISIN